MGDSVFKTIQELVKEGYSVRFEQGLYALRIVLTRWGSQFAQEFPPITDGGLIENEDLVILTLNRMVRQFEEVEQKINKHKEV